MMSEPAARGRRIEQAARAITGRLVPQLPDLGRFHCTLLFRRGRRGASRGGPYRTDGRDWMRRRPQAARLVLR
jgi:hypothetical protein